MDSFPMHVIVLSSQTWPLCRISSGRWSWWGPPPSRHCRRLQPSTWMCWTRCRCTSSANWSGPMVRSKAPSDIIALQTHFMPPLIVACLYSFPQGASSMPDKLCREILSVGDVYGAMLCRRGHHPVASQAQARRRCHCCGQAPQASEGTDRSLQVSCKGQVWHLHPCLQAAAGNLRSSLACVFHQCHVSI